MKGVFIIVDLFVSDAPQVTLTLGSNINASQIKEGQDVYFDCSVKANPWVRLVTWKHSVSKKKNLRSIKTSRGVKLPLFAFFFLQREKKT